jgi:hypothetical protein
MRPVGVNAAHPSRVLREFNAKPEQAAPVTRQRARWLRTQDPAPDQLLNGVQLGRQPARSTTR